MPTYEYRCQECDHVQEEVHSIRIEPEITCENCGHTPLERLISRNIGGFVLKGDTPAKLWKEKRSRVKKNADLEVRQLERYGSGPRLQPNVAGMETETWTEASKLAKEAGMSTESYTPMIEKEKSTSKSSNVDDRAYKAAKNKRDNS